MNEPIHKPACVPVTVQARFLLGVVLSLYAVDRTCAVGVTTAGFKAVKNES